MSSKTIKNRIKSTKNIKQTARAMEAVSAVKMRRSQMLAIRARPYALAALEILRSVEKNSKNGESEISPLLSKHTEGKVCYVIVTSDKGLAGAFNTSVIRKAEKVFKENIDDFYITAIGKKGRDYFARLRANQERSGEAEARKKFDIVAEYTGTGDYGEIAETKHISEFLIKDFLDKKFSKVVLIYTNFLSALKQDVIVQTLLPFSKESLTEIVESISPLRGKYANMPKVLGNIKPPSSDVLFEPSPIAVLSKLLPELLEVEIFHAILEANASEHSSRMIAMKNASENASELINELNISYNKARQALITKELAEITGGAAALEQ